MVPDPPGAAVGALYRHVATARRYGASLLSSNFLYVSRNGLLTNRIVDGVVHFKVTPFAWNGYPIVSDFGYTNAFYTTNRHNPRYFAAVANANTSANVYFQDRINFNFFSNAVPAFLELEVGILEKEVLRTIPLPAYKQRHAAAAVPVDPFGPSPPLPPAHSHPQR